MLGALLESASMFDMHINCIHVPYWRGYIEKIISVQQAIQTLPEDAIVCFMDAFDVVVCGGEQEILAKYHAFGKELVFSAEFNCFPEEYRPQYPEHTGSNYRFLNAGGYIGTKRAIAACLAWKPITYQLQVCARGTDQAYMHEYFLAHQDTVALDTQCTLFQSVYRTRWTEMVCTEGRVLNKVLNTHPCFLHFNGGAMRIATDQPNVFGDVMPVFIASMRTSKEGDDVTFDGHRQLQDPLPQV